MSEAGFRIGARVRSFGHAFRGLALLLRGEHNAWIHAAATLAALGLGLALGLSRGEWLALVLVIALVWSAEAFNTAIEFLADAITTEVDPRIRDAKDVAAGGVLICAGAAIAVGILIFGRRILLLLAA